MKQYLDLMHDVFWNGEIRGDRTGVGTRSVFGRQMRFDLLKGFPLVTTKTVNFKAIVVELLWFLRGDTNIAYLHKHGVHIWDDWADERGEVGPMYGSQWRNQFNEDQLIDLVDNLASLPFSRRHVVSAWNPDDLPDESISPQANVRNGKMALAPCHCLFQFYVSNDKRLSCQVYQRSADLFLGAPFNVASYALLTHMVAQQDGLNVGELIWVGGDVHLYGNHGDQAAEQLKRVPRPLPWLKISSKPDSLFDYQVDDFMLLGYDPHPVIKAPRAV